MKWFYDLKIATKLLLSFVMVLALMLAVGIVSIMNMATINGSTVDLGSNWLPSVRSVMVLKYDLQMVRRMELGYYIATTPDERVMFAKRTDESLAQLRKDDAIYAGLISEPEEKRVHPEFLKTLDSYLAVHGKITARVDQDDKDGAKALLLGDSATLLTTLGAQIDALVKVNLDGANHSTLTAERVYNSSTAPTIPPSPPNGSTTARACGP